MSGTFIDQEKWDNAVEMLKKVLVFDPQNGKVNFYLSDIYEKKGEREKAKEELKIAFESPNVEIDLKIKKLEGYLNVMSLNPEIQDFVFELIDILVDTHPDDPKSFTMKGDILYKQGKTKEARDNYRKALELNKGIYFIWSQVLIIDQQLSDNESLDRESQEALDLFPSQPLFYFFNGFAKHRLGKNEEAVEILEIGKDLVTDESEILLNQIYNVLADSYHDLEEHEKSDASFEESIRLNPDDPFVLNNYSYYLSVREVNLDKAEKMSLKSNQIDPNNPSFQDTYGWILFKIGKYEASEEWLKKALISGGENSTTILEHYGDVLFKLGQKESALEYWNKAKVAGSSSELLEKKIVDKMLYE